MVQGKTQNAHLQTNIYRYRFEVQPSLETAEDGDGWFWEFCWQTLG